MISLVETWDMRIEFSEGPRVCSQPGTLALAEERFDRQNVVTTFSGRLYLGNSTCPDLDLMTGSVRVSGYMFGEPSVGSRGYFEPFDCGGGCLNYSGYAFTVKDPNLLLGSATVGNSLLSFRPCDWVAERRR